MRQVPKNKYHGLLADPPEIDISIPKISEDVKKKKKGSAAYSAIAFGCKSRK
jgi:hypothetical protein